MDVMRCPEKIMDEKQLKTVVYVFFRTSIGRYEGVGWRPLPPPIYFLSPVLLQVVAGRGAQAPHTQTHICRSLGRFWL